MQGRTREQLYQQLMDISRPPDGMPPATYAEWHQYAQDNPPKNLSDAARIINTLTRETSSLDPRMYEALTMAKYADAATILRDIPGGRDDEAAQEAGTTTADAFYLMMKRRGDDIENQQIFRGHLIPEQLEKINSAEPEPMQAMSTRLFEEQVAQFPPEAPAANLPEHGTIMPPIETGRIMDICHARQLYEHAWYDVQVLDDRKTLLEQSKALLSGVDAELDFNDLRVLHETRAINGFYLALVRHDLTALDNEDNRLRNSITNEAVLTLWDAEETVRESRAITGDQHRLAPYLEKIQHFRRVYSSEIGINPETRPEIEQPNSTIRAIGTAAAERTLRAA